MSDLNESQRSQLDQIVSRMSAEGEPDENIHAVIADFKSKYAGPQIPPEVSSGKANATGSNPPSWWDRAKGSFQTAIPDLMETLSRKSPIDLINEAPWQIAPMLKALSDVRNNPETVGNLLGQAPLALLDGVPSTGPLGPVAKGAFRGAVDAPKLSLPGILGMGGTGELLSRLTGHGDVGALAGAIPPIYSAGKGAVKGATNAFRDYYTPVVPRLGPRPPVWEGLEPSGLNTSNVPIGPVGAPALPSGRVPGPAPAPVPSPRVPVWNVMPETGSPIALESAAQPAVSPIQPISQGPSMPTEPALSPLPPIDKFEGNRLLHARAKELELPGSPAGSNKGAHDYLHNLAVKRFGVRSVMDLTPEQMKELHGLLGQ